jgi:uncharacterized protein (UPF0548 family)
MFLLRRPSKVEIEHFLDHSQNLSLSYDPPGILNRPSTGYQLDEQVIAIGRGEADFEQARVALLNWKHFDIGWVEAYPSHESITVGTDVAVLIRHLGFWSLNGARVLYFVGDDGTRRSFGFAYGTLANHAETGEELFEVFLDPQNNDLFYRIRAMSRPRSPLAWLGLPYVRRLQARFRHDSAAAMRRITQLD